MNKKILLTLLLTFIIVFSISAVQAGDVNITDSDAIASVDNEDIEIETSGESVNSNTLSTNDDIVKNATEITSNDTDIYYKGSYSVTLKDSNSNATLADREVNFQINDVNYTSFSDSDGVAILNLTLNPGEYAVFACFSGDDMYEASNLTSTINVLSTINASDITKYYLANTPYTARFLDSTGNPLAGQNVTISVNGKTYTRKTDDDGMAALDINLAPGTYKVIATDPLTGYKLTTTFKVLSTISASATSKVIGDSRKFTAKFYKSNGKALANTYVKFKINGKTYKVKTDSNGAASLSLKNLKKGTYKLTCYNVDGLSKTVKVTIYKKVSTSFTTKTYTFFKSESKKIKVKLSTSLGYAPTSGKLIKITVDKKTYYKKTNSKGEVTLNLPSLKKGIHTIKYKFSGTSHYKASSATSKVVVITTNDTKFAVKSKKTFGYGASTKFKVAVTAGGVGLVKKTVTFKVNGKTYKKTTDNKGVASLTINLGIGNYTITYSISKDSKVNENNGSCDIKVKKRSESQIKWKSGTTFKGSTQTFKVLVTDLNGKALSGKTVQLKIGSKTYTATTDSKGYATFKVSKDIGEYKVSVKFVGCNDYLPDTTSKTVEVTFSKLKNGINQKNTISDLAKYLKSSKHCKVGSAKLKKLVDKLTKGLTSEYDKAKAIFKYVRDTLSYSFYYNTKYGASGTLTAKRGNCVDHSHLLVAMFRTAGLASRYVHGKCTFSSGGKYGHVWAQVLIGGTWVCADATSSRNSLGKIANWNTKHFTLNGKYSSLPF